LVALAYWAAAFATTGEEMAAADAPTGCLRFQMRATTA
jgi:hypothetical protein